ncbi:MAG: hypothetical protein FWE69_08005, partial [Clostridiales bacterium]|nr:hypothetical protein [Clostridiales bacterium]
IYEREAQELRGLGVKNAAVIIEYRNTDGSLLYSAEFSVPESSVSMLWSIVVGVAGTIVGVWGFSQIVGGILVFYGNKRGLSRHLNALQKIELNRKMKMLCGSLALWSILIIATILVVAFVLSDYAIAYCIGLGLALLLSLVKRIRGFLLLEFYQHFVEKPGKGKGKTEKVGDDKAGEEPIS